MANNIDKMAINTINELFSKLSSNQTTIMVCGEFKRGKSTLINALLDMPLCPTDEHIATSTVSIIKYMNTLKCKIILFLGLGLAACSDNFTDLEDGQGNEIALRTIKLDVSVNDLSRSGNISGFTNSFYLYIDQTGDDYDYFVKMNYADGKWKPDTEEQLYFIDDENNFQYSALCFSDDTKVMTKDDYCNSEFKYLGGSDVLYAKKGDEDCSIDTKGKLTIKFSHLYSRLSFSYVDGEISAGELPTSITVSGIRNSFQWAASSGDFSTAELYDDDSEIVINKGSDDIYTYFAIPQEVETVTLDLGDKYSCYVDNLNLAPGSAVKINLSSTSADN